MVRASLLKPQNFALPPPLFRVHTNRAESFGRDSLDGLVKREVQRETTPIRVGANLARVSPAPAPTVQVECRNRQIALGFSIILIRKRKAMGRRG